MFIRKRFFYCVFLTLITLVGYNKLYMSNIYTIICERSENLMNKIQKVLVANRGEIALRIMQACEELDIKTVAIYSKEDYNSQHRFKADEAFLVGEDKSPTAAYLDIENIIKLAKENDVDAIHPGYGFISESCEFAYEVEKNGLIWIGPSYSVMKSLDDKLKVKRIASKIGIPIIKDYKFNSIKEKDLPVAIKSVSGAGSRCIGIVERIQDLNDLYNDIKSKSLNYFNSSKVYIEKFIDGFRHIEIQFIVSSILFQETKQEQKCSKTTF